MSFVTEFFRRLGIFLVGIPVGMFLAALCLLVGTAFSILGTTLVMVFCAFIALLFVVSPFVKLFGFETPIKKVKETFKEGWEKGAGSTGKVQPFPNRHGKDS